jgi:hypothetical protein
LKFPGITKPLQQTTVEVLDNQDEGWDEKSGTPTRFFIDMGSRCLTFDRELPTSGTVQLTVLRLPLVRLTASNLTAELETQELDDELIHGALKYLYLMPDIEGYDAALAAKWESRFEADIAEILMNRGVMGPSEMVTTTEFF